MINVGIFGSSRLPELSNQDREYYLALGRYLGNLNATVHTGASTGIPELIVKEAVNNGAKFVGHSPHKSLDEHLRYDDNTKMNPEDIHFYGSGYSGRSIKLIGSVDISIAGYGDRGTLTECLVASEENMRLGIVPSSNMIPIVNRLNSLLTKKINYVSEDDPILLVNKMVGLDLWNLLSNNYSEYYSLMDERLGYEVVLNLLGEAKGKRVLDYGCGSGKFSRRLDQLGAIVTGVDISEQAIQQGKKKEGNVYYKVISNEDLSFIGESSLDFAVANFVFCTIKDDDKIKRIVQQIYTKLKPEGHLIICEPHPDSDGYDYTSMRRHPPKERVSGTPIKVELKGMTSFYDYWRPLERYVNIVKESGLTVENIEEPIIESDNKETIWKDERVQAPLLTIQCKK